MPRHALSREPLATVLTGDLVLALVSVLLPLPVVVLLRVHSHLVHHHLKEVEVVFVADVAVLPLVVLLLDLALLLHDLLLILLFLLDEDLAPRLLPLQRFQVLAKLLEAEDLLLLLLAHFVYKCATFNFVGRLGYQDA